MYGACCASNATRFSKGSTDQGTEQFTPKRETCPPPDNTTPPAAIITRRKTIDVRGHAAALCQGHNCPQMVSTRLTALAEATPQNNSSHTAQLHTHASSSLTPLPHYNKTRSRCVLGFGDQTGRVGRRNKERERDRVGTTAHAHTACDIGPSTLPAPTPRAHHALWLPSLASTGQPKRWCLVPLPGLPSGVSAGRHGAKSWDHGQGLHPTASQVPLPPSTRRRQQLHGCELFRRCSCSARQLAE